MIDLPPWLRRIANRVIRHAVPCHVATTEREFEAIARLRYAVYVAEQKVPVPDADHARGRLWDEADREPGVLHFYAGTVENMLGCLRVRAWKPGQVPSEIRAHYSMDLLPGVERLAVCDVTRMVAVPQRRGTAAMAALTAYAIEETVSRHRNSLMVAACRPGLLRAYRAIGLRTFGARAIRTPWGMMIPLIGLTADVEHTRRLGSPWYDALRRLEERNLLPPELPAYRALAAQDRSALTEAAEVREELRAFAARRGSAFLDELPPEALDALARYGTVLDVAAGVEVCREGLAEREVYLNLSGEFEVSRGDQSLARLGAGALFGEMAALDDSGLRTADVRAVTPARVLVLRRKFLRELAASSPTVARAVEGALVRERQRKLGVERAPTALVLAHAS